MHCELTRPLTCDECWQAIEMYGLHNWAEVSEHVGTKSKLDCHVHYKEIYLRSKTAPLPDMSNIIGKDSSRITQTPSRITGSVANSEIPSSVDTVTHTGINRGSADSACLAD